MLTALRDVRNSIEESILSASVRPDSCLAQGVAEACGQYRRHLNAIGQLQGGGGVQFQQLEIVVLTGGDQATVRKQLDFDDSSLDMNHIKNLHPDSSHCKLVFPCPSKAAGLTVPIHSLSVVGTLPADTVCDSLIFGLPLLAHATSCWRIDWEELEQNAASLHALCQELISKNQVLLAQLQPPDVTHGTRGANDSLLVKSVATRDLTLPSACPVSGCDVTEDSVLRVQSSLTQVRI
nr:hypothetical protein BaRGS_030270 [Batillaria attramentaria]